MAAKKTTAIDEAIKQIQKLSQPSSAATELTNKMNALTKRLQNPVVGTLVEKVLSPSHAVQAAELLEQANGPDKGGAAHLLKLIDETNRKMAEAKPDPLAERLGELSQAVVGAHARLDEIERGMKVLIAAFHTLASKRATTDLGTTPKKKKGKPN